MTNYIVRVNDTRPNVRVDPTNNIVRVIQPTYSLTISSPVVGNFAAVSHTHVLANITDAGTAAAADTGDFAAASHTHVLADITDAGTAAAADTGDFAADDHTHSFTDLTDVEWGRFNFPTPLNGNVVQYLNGKWSNNSLNQANIQTSQGIDANNNDVTVFLNQATGKPIHGQIFSWNEDFEQWVNLWFDFDSMTTTGTLPSDRLPAIDASKIETGTLDSARIPSLDATKLTTGTLNNNRLANIPVSKLSGTLQNSQVAESNVTQHAAAVAAAIDLGDLSNVNIPILTNGLVLTYDQSTDKWIASSPSGHTHVLADITDAGTAAAADTGDFAAASHTHVLADITDAGTAAAADTGDFAAASHTHAASDITSGTLDDARIDLRVDHGATFDGQGSAITASESVLVPVERAGVIKAASLVGDVSGTITITVKRYTPSAGLLGSATSLGTIALSSAQHARDTTLSGWTTSLSAGDVLEFVTTATIANVTRVTVKLKVELA